VSSSLYCDTVCNTIDVCIPANNSQARWQNFEKATVIFVMSVPQYICLHGTTRSCWTDFHEILYLRIYTKSVVKI